MNKYLAKGKLFLYTRSFSTTMMRISIRKEKNVLLWVGKKEDLKAFRVNQ
jgi:hypothetical protein